LKYFLHFKNGGVHVTGSLNFWDFEVWRFVVMLAVLTGAMLLANLLRRVIKPLRRSLIPSSVIAGFLVLIIEKLYYSITGISMFTTVALEALTYHGLGLGFIAVALRSAEKQTGKKARRDVFNTSLVVVSTYLLQAFVGLAITLGLSYVIGNWASGGILLPMGYGQGPGQAYNWGHIYETATDYAAFPHGTSFGLTVAAMGFISASLGGVFYLNQLKRAGSPKASVTAAEEVENLTAEMVTEKGEIPLSESMDKFTVQAGMVLLVYLISFGFMWFASIGLDSLGGFWSGTVKPLLWGFNFLVGTGFAVLLKVIFGKFKRRGMIRRQYLNNFMLNRIAGFMFDLMVVASIAAIDLSAFTRREFILPLVLVCAAGMFVTYWYNKKVCFRLFPDYPEESFLALYGMLTGTASTGIILLREIDPLFTTPASGNIIYQNLWAILFGFPMLLLLGVVAQSLTMSWITLGLLALLFFAIFVLMYRRFIFRRRKTK
jgi:ESS family glutamate:Na+ symporter